MVSTGTIFAVVVIVIILLAGLAVALVYFMPGARNTGPSTSTGGTTSSSISTSSHTQNLTVTKTVTSTKNSSIVTSAVTQVTTTATENTSTSYALQPQVTAGGPIINSSLKSPVPLTYFLADGLGGDCGNSTCYTYNYTDNGNPWTVQGDFEPGRAWLSANSSGFTLTDQTCSSPGNPVRVCGPYWEFNGDRRFVNGILTGEENVSELSGALYGVPPTAQIFSIYLTLPKYDFTGCVYNISSNGCSYEGGGPSIAGVWALDSGGTQNGTTYSNSVAVSLAEGTTGLSVGISTATIINGEYQASLSKNLSPLKPVLVYSPNHKLTIATDRHSFLRIWIDGTLEYTSNKMPVDLSGNSVAVNFYQFDNVDNMTLSTTWSNFTSYNSANVTVSGLSSGMSIVISGAGGFNKTVAANSSGFAVADVSGDPAGLSVIVTLNGKVIDTYAAPVNAGSQLKLATNTTTFTTSKAYTTTYTTTYATTVT